ncbi:MAG: fimbrillin family protein [Tannerellaceae bacterium]|nr:fimbrillin family protein [Tannerellaceae bacterium]
MKQNLNTKLSWCLMAILAIGLFSCNEEKDTFPDSGNELHIGVEGITTRALENSFTSMDRIGLFAVSSPEALLPSDNYADNIRFTLVNDAEGTWTPEETIYYPANGGKLDLYGYYPYTDPLFQPNATIIPFRIHADQREYENYTNSDLLIAEKKEVSRSVNKVNLVFDHKLAQMAFALKAGGDGFTVEDIKNAEITILNAIIDATYDLAEGSSGIPVAGETKANILPTGEWLASQNDASAMYGKKAIIIPQELNLDTYIQIKIGTLTFVKKFQEPIPLYSGESRDFIITVNNRELEITTTLNPWNHGDPIEGDANEVPEAKVSLQWNEEKQVIEGFGVSQAGWAYNLWAHKKRDELMGWLFGEQGLRLNMLRGEVFPHYSPAPGEYSFDLDANVDASFNDPIFTEVDLENVPDEALRRGQLWVTREAKKHLVSGN